MNNLFLNHLKTISPEGRDSETRLFVSKDKIAEATQSKVSKARAGINPNKNYPTLKNTEDKYATRLKAREAAMLRRGGADPESVRDAINDPGGYYANVPAMIGRSRFVGMSIRSREDGRKSPRNPKPVAEMSTTPDREAQWHKLPKNARNAAKWRKERESSKVYGKGGKVLNRKPGEGDFGLWIGARPKDPPKRRKRDPNRFSNNPIYDVWKEATDYAGEMRNAWKRIDAAGRERVKKAKKEGAVWVPKSPRKPGKAAKGHWEMPDGTKVTGAKVNEDFGRFLNINKPKQKPKSIFTGKNIVKSAKQIGLIGKNIGRALSTPMSNLDSMITGRNF
jgi:hypothetical protein